MKQILYSILLAGAICLVLGACNNGDYIANPDTNANNSLNPLKPLTQKDFTWVGHPPMSAKINGAQKNFDSVIYSVDTAGRNYIAGFNGKSRLYFYLKDVWQGNIYTLDHKSPDRIGTYTDSVGKEYKIFTSALGNSGEVYMLANDTLHISGMFYFQSLDTSGMVYNFTEGFFSIPRTDWWLWH
jgi:hypothetical protein